jgi:DMSO/TMAO reductase YedYZ molybdopterin-dependent catalytic subunit
MYGHSIANRDCKMKNTSELASRRVLSRRMLLKRAGQFGAFAGVARVTPWGWPERLLAQAPSTSERRIVRSIRPQDLETPVGWKLTVDGVVDRPLSLTLADLRRMPSVSLPVTLECAGNGRAFFEPPVAGVQWEKGAVGNARWTGVRLADVLRSAAPKVSAQFIWLNGADTPLGKMPDFVRQLPLAKALDASTILAYEMNGQPLPIANGFPLRAIVPGWEAAYSIKWLTHLEVRDREHDGFWVQTAYRYPTMRVAPGAAVDPKNMAPLGGLAVKSIITSPAEGAVLAPGEISITGFAWAGEANVTRVEVSVDNGSTWTAAAFGSDRAPYAWRQFRFDWRAEKTGSFVVLARAADDRGRVQPIVPHWNPSGYLWNAVERIRVNVQ